MKYKVQCTNCGDDCGTFDQGRTFGPVESCYPPEWVEEPEIIEDVKRGDDRYFCSTDCQRDWHIENDDPEDMWNKIQAQAAEIEKLRESLRDLARAYRQRVPSILSTDGAWSPVLNAEQILSAEGRQ